jgi:hypothetical protein
MIATPSPKTWVTNMPITVGDLNTEIRDALRFIAQGAHCTALLSADQSIPDSTWTTLTFGNIIDDTDNIIAEPSGTFTFARAGMITLRFNGTFAADSGGVRREFQILLNAGIIGSTADSTSDTNRISECLSIDFPVAAGDVLNVQAYQAATHALNVDYTATQLTMGWVGKTAPWANPDLPPPTPAPDPSLPPTGQTPTFHTATYVSTWSRSYDTGGAMTFNDPAYCSQGNVNPAWGNNNTRSLVGFPYATIQSDLAGATGITMTLKFFAGTTKPAGATIVIGAHNYTAKPSTWTGSNVWQNDSRLYVMQGASYETVLSSFLTTGFQSGRWAGIAFGPGLDNSGTYYALLNGATQGNSPKLIVTYYKG